MLSRRKHVIALTIVIAIIIKLISYRNYRGEMVNVPVSTVVYVDVSSGIALVGDDHIEIGKDEYQAINTVLMPN